MKFFPEFASPNNEINKLNYLSKAKPSFNYFILHSPSIKSFKDYP